MYNIPNELFKDLKTIISELSECMSLMDEILDRIEKMKD
jgi:hypothetical protein